ncbi:MAG: tyrosine-type recombinase/integrase [Steroidobacteraceae bacterium]
MLTELALRGARPADKPQKLFDGRGLYLLVSTAGARVWRLKYRFEGRERVLDLGDYPEVSLKRARERCEEARRLIANGVDPAPTGGQYGAGDAQTVEAPSRSFEAAAREWWAARWQAERWDEGYAVQILRQFERDVFRINVTRGLPPDQRALHPLLQRPVGDWSFDALTPPDVLEICRNIEARGSLDTARDLRSRISMVFQREKVLGRCTLNPAADVTALLAKPKRTNHATIAYDELPAFFKKLDAEKLDDTTRLGLEAVIATWLRSTELRLARWAWLDWKARELRIPSDSMKNGDKGRGDHVVPLSDYALDVFRRLQVITGHGELMFPSLKHPGEPISEGAWLNALYRMDYRNKATVHGIRALGSTTANEAHVSVPGVPAPVKMWESRWIDRQLDHVDRSVSGRYNRAEYLEPRRALMQWWGKTVREARALARRGVTGETAVVTTMPSEGTDM